MNASYSRRSGHLGYPWIVECKDFIVGFLTKGQAMTMASRYPGAVLWHKGAIKFINDPNGIPWDA